MRPASREPSARGRRQIRRMSSRHARRARSRRANPGSGPAAARDQSRIVAKARLSCVPTARAGLAQEPLDVAARRGTFDEGRRPPARMLLRTREAANSHIAFTSARSRSGWQASPQAGEHDRQGRIAPRRARSRRNRGLARPNSSVVELRDDPDTRGLETRQDRAPSRQAAGPADRARRRDRAP